MDSLPPPASPILKNPNWWFDAFMASARSSPSRRSNVTKMGESASSNEFGSRRALQASIAKAEELRALHATLLQGRSPANRNAAASPVAHSRPVTQFSAQDYPVFTPSYEEETSLRGRRSRTLSGRWDDYGVDIRSIAANTLSYRQDLATGACASEIHDHFIDDIKAWPCASSCRNQASAFKSSSPNTEFILRHARRKSLGEFGSLLSSNRSNPLTKNTETDMGFRSLNSSIVAPSTDTHLSLMARRKSKGILSLSWLFSTNKKKLPKFESSPYRMAHQADQLSNNFKDMGILSVEKLKKELMKATEEKEAALLEVSEMGYSLRELKHKLEVLESYCREIKKALKHETKDTQKLNNLDARREKGKPMDKPGSNNLMPVSEEVMAEGFLQIVSEARLSVIQFCKCLVAQIEESDGGLTDNLNILLQHYEVSLPSKSSKSVLYHLEAVVNQILYQDFENPVFQKNGAQKHLDLHKHRQAQFALYAALRNLSWNEVLKKGTKHYSEELSKFCDQKMICIISMLNWNNPWPEQLLQAFFVTAKCIWLLHLLAFSFEPPLTIIRVEENANFDPRYMEEVGLNSNKSRRDLKRVKIMVMPGFYIHDKVFRCQVIAQHHP